MEQPHCVDSSAPRMECRSTYGSTAAPTMVLSHLTPSVTLGDVIASFDDNSLHFESEPHFVVKLGNCLRCHVLGAAFIECQGSCVPRADCDPAVEGVYRFCTANLPTPRPFAETAPQQVIASDWRSLGAGPVSVIPVHVERQISIIVEDAAGNHDSCFARVYIKSP